MNEVHSLAHAVQAARTAAAPNSASRLRSLISLNEAMIAELRDERDAGTGRADFFHALIGHHEKTAALLRVQLALQTADAAYTTASFAHRFTPALWPLSA
jgi:hypothetical protein